MQIKITGKDKRRVDFYGNTTEGVYIELVDKYGLTYHSQKLNEEERLQLINTLSRENSGNSV